MTHARFKLSLLALGLPAVLALAACQAPHATTPAGKGTAVVKVRMAKPARQVLVAQERPLQASDIRLLRISLTNQSDLRTMEAPIATPGAEVAVAFRHLRSNTDYLIEARAFTSANPGPGTEVAYATAALEVDNEMDVAFGEISLKLADKPYNGQMTATGIAVISGDYTTPATTAVRVDYDTVTTLAGNGNAYVDGPANTARFGAVSGLVEANGKLYMADAGNNVIRMYDPDTEQVTTEFGDLTASPGHLDDPVGTGATLFDNPSDVVTDGAGHLYVSDRDNHVIRKIELATGKVSTLVGQVGVTGSFDATAASTFGEIEAIAYASDALYVADTTNHTIRMVDLTTMMVSTIAGMAGMSGTDDTYLTDPQKPPSDARFTQPKGIAVRFEGGDRYIYVADTDNHRIRRILTSNGQTTVSTVAGNGGGDGNAPQDGVGSAALFRLPMGLTFNGDGDLVVADFDSAAIRIVTPQGRVTTYAGFGGWSGRGWRDGPQRASKLEFVREVFFNGSTLYFYDANNMLRKME